MNLFGKSKILRIKVWLKKLKAFYMPFQVDCSKYKKSPPEERVCYDLYAPICGSDGKTYSNECYFCYEVEKTKNKLKFAHFGKC
uniref:Serine peptidase inhibitor Kazal type 9 n=1 Tax=Sus scrofa TaxID=9823 RepID=A0A8D0SPT5_PIG